MEPVQASHPVRLVVTDDLRRSRLTVFFRWLLAIPHLLWLGLWSCRRVRDRRHQLVRDARQRAFADRAPRLPRRVPPLRDADRGVPPARREPVPAVLRRECQAVRRRPRDRPAGSAESLEDGVPSGARHTRPPRRGRPYRRPDLTRARAAQASPGRPRSSRGSPRSRGRGRRAGCATRRPGASATARRPPPISFSSPTATRTRIRVSHLGELEPPEVDPLVPRLANDDDLQPLAAHRAPPPARSRSRTSSGSCSGRSSRFSRRSRTGSPRSRSAARRDRSPGSSPRTSATRCTCSRSSTSSGNPFPGFVGKAGQLPARHPHRSVRARRAAGRPSSASSSLIPAAFVSSATGTVLFVVAVLALVRLARARRDARAGCSAPAPTRSATPRS